MSASPSHTPGHAKANSAKFSVHTIDLGKPNPEMEERLKRSKKEGHLRVFTKEDSVAAIKEDNPFEKIVADYYEQRVREIRAKTFSPPVVPWWSMATRHFASYFDERLKANCERIMTSSGIGVMPFLYKCPHPTAEEMEAFQNSWDDDGEAYKEALKKALKINPDYKWGFLPFIIFGVEKHSTVMICVLLVGSPKE